MNTVEIPAVTSARPRRRAALAVVSGFSALALLAGCGSVTGSSDAGVGASGTSRTSTATSPSSTDAPAGREAILAAMPALCRKIDSQLQDWRVQGATLGRGALNLTVTQWVIDEKVDAATFGRDLGIVDEGMKKSCPEVRDGARSALHLENIVDGLFQLRIG